jgi:DNA mismatch repair protein PMS2
VAEKKELQRIQKFTAICAMKACREAIKVGDSLSREQMKTEVGNLAGLGSPWNCPHGRPTLIELGSIEGFKSGIKVAK